jgi:hypothetical protein
VLCSVLENGSEGHKKFILQKVILKAAELGLDRDGSKLLENCIKMKGNFSQHLDALLN